MFDRTMFDRAMFDRRILLFAALFCFISQALALPVHVKLAWPAGTPANSIQSIHIQAVRTAGPPNNGAPLAFAADSPPAGTLLNLSEGVWQVLASAPGYWSQHADVTIASQTPAEVQIALWPAASLHGEIRTFAGEPLPHALILRLSSVEPSSATPSANKAAPPLSAPQSEPALPNADLLCQIDKGTWSCLGPAGLFDMELLASGYTPRYVWSVNLHPAGSNDLGRTVLRRAASLFGRAVLKDGSHPQGPCQAILQPDLERHGPGESDSGELANEQNFSVPVSRNGYFQVVGMMPGRHVLMVKCPAASGFRKLDLQAEGETQIDPPLRLEDLTLDIAVTPKLDPQGRPWQLTVDMTAPLYRRVANSDALSGGQWSRRGLMAGNYHVSINSSNGTLWLQKYFDLDARSRPLSLRLLSAKVAGRVSLSSMPVRAQVVFSNDAGGQSVTLQSDNNGRFQGTLPVTDPDATSWTVEARVAQPPVTQQLLGVNVPVGSGNTAWLDLELPSIAVRGSVVSPSGKPQAGADVTFEASNGFRTTTSTDAAGNFEMPDLPPGKYTAAADSQDGSSDRTPFEVTAGSSSELKLVLNPFPRIHFNVVSNDGPVANAAVQVWIKPGVPRAFARTDQNGSFEVTVPPGTTEVGLTVGAPGYAIKLARLKLPGENDSRADANTITLDDSGGTLVLNFHPPDGAPDNASMLYLVHDGAIQDARTISGWGANQAAAGGEGSATVDSIEPGKYALCSLADPSQVTAIWSGALPQDRCRTGSLEQGETLTLSPPAIPHPLQSSNTPANTQAAQ